MMIRKMRKGVRVTAFGVRNTGPVVMTVPVARWRVAVSLAVRSPSRLGDPAGLLEAADRIIARREAVLRNVRLGTVPAHFFANLRFRDDTILQDQTARLGDLLGYGLNALGLIDRYIDRILEGWRFGFAEMSFDFPETYGLDREGALVVIDPSSVTFSRAEVAEAVGARSWEGILAERSDLTPALRKYLFREMRRRLTPEALDEMWLEAHRTREAPLRLVRSDSLVQKAGSKCMALAQ